MARLTIANVAAPDLSESARILEGANRSFNAGLTSASSVLDKYNQGQQEAEDNAVLGQIAGLKSEQELQSFLNSDSLKGRNFSETMRKNIIGLRSGILVNAGKRISNSNAVSENNRANALNVANIANKNASTGFTQANTRSVDAGTEIKRAAEGRTVAQFNDAVSARDEARNLEALRFQALQENQKNGVPNAIALRDGKVVPGSATQTFNDAVAKSLRLNPGDADAFLKSQNEAQKTGQSNIAAAEEAVRKERLASNALAVSGASSTNNAESFVAGVTDQSYPSATERLAANAEAQNLAKQLESRIAPTGSSDVSTRISDSVKLRNLSADREIEAAPQTRLIATAKKYEADPVKSLKDDLSVGADGKDPSTYFFGLFGEDPDDVILTRQVNEIARRAGVTPALAASAMKEKFIRDPSGSNTVARRFPLEDTVEYIKTYLSQDALTKYDEKVVVNESRKANLSKLEAELKALQITATKSGSNLNPLVSRRIAEIDRELSTSQAADKSNPGTGVFRASVQKSRSGSINSYIKESRIIEAIKDAPIGSSKRTAISNQIMSEITNNPSLSDSDKAQIISKILNVRSTLK